MRIHMFGTLAFATVATIVYAQKVDVDSDPSAPFAKYKTYAWAQGSPSPTPLGERRIHAAVNQRLAANGMTQVIDTPDVFVASHVMTEHREQLMANGFGGWGFGGLATATIEPYVQGTLVVDLYDAATMRLVWRGVATAVASDKAQKNTSNINKGLDQMFEKYPPAPENR